MTEDKRDLVLEMDGLLVNHLDGIFALCIQFVFHVRQLFLDDSLDFRLEEAVQVQASIGLPLEGIVNALVLASR